MLFFLEVRGKQLEIFTLFHSLFLIYIQIVPILAIQIVHALLSDDMLKIMVNAADILQSIDIDVVVFFSVGVHDVLAV